MKKFFLICIILFSCSGCSKNNNLLSVHIIDVGQGDCILITTPSNNNILIDSGDENTYKIVKSYLKIHKIKNIDMIIATHLDKDHIGSLDDVINNFNVKNVYTPNQKDDSPHYYNLIKSCKNKNINISHLKKGDQIKLNNNLSINVLGPSHIQDNNNLNSIVLNLNYADMDFLFTGDCEEPNEIDIVDSFNLEGIDFLKVAHHGSSTSSSDNFIKEVSPDIGVISCGYKNQYGHPHRSTLDTLEKYNVNTFRTDLNGDLVFYSDGEKIFTNKKYKQ